MGVDDPGAWVENLERLYRVHDAEAVRALYEKEAHTRFGRELLPPEWVQAHPEEWFGSLEDYEITRTFRAATGDVIVSETEASYVQKSDGARYREFGVDIYWVNDQGKIYHKHTIEVVEPFQEDALADVQKECRTHPGPEATRDGR